jgi:hypothetical protein
MLSAKWKEGYTLTRAKEKDMLIYSKMSILSYSNIALRWLNFGISSPKTT